MEVLFQNKNYIVCVKPAGVISESNGIDGFPDLIEKETGKNVYTIHRLDKVVSGVMVYALNKEAAANLSRQVSDRQMKKQYTALIHNVPEKAKGVFTDLLFKDSAKNKAFVVKRDRRGVKKAELDYEVIDKFQKDDEILSVVEINLHTGRFHQIRVQFASRNMPVCGDRRYGAKDEYKNVMLFSTKLEFCDPESGETVVYKHIPPICKL